MHRAALRRTDRFLLHDAKHNFTVFDHDEYAYAIIEPRVRRLGIRIMRDDGNPTRNHHAKDLPARSTRLKWRALASSHYSGTRSRIFCTCAHVLNDVHNMLIRLHRDAAAPIGMLRLSGPALHRSPQARCPVEEYYVTVEYQVTLARIHARSLLHVHLVPHRSRHCLAETRKA